MTKSLYHSTLKSMQDAGVNPQYAFGWSSGVLANPTLEEQRITEAYTAGYADGENAECEGYSKWVEKS